MEIANSVVAKRPKIRRGTLAGIIRSKITNAPKEKAIENAIDKWQGLGKMKNPPPACVTWRLRTGNPGRPKSEK